MYNTDLFISIFTSAFFVWCNNVWKKKKKEGEEVELIESYKSYQVIKLFPGMTNFVGQALAKKY